MLGGTKPRPSISLTAQRLELESQRISLLFQASNEMNRLNIWIGFLNSHIFQYRKEITSRQPNIFKQRRIYDGIVQKIEAFVFLDIFDENDQNQSQNLMSNDDEKYSSNDIEQSPPNIHFLQSSEMNSVSIQNHILHIQTSNSILYESISKEIERLTAIIRSLSQNLLQLLKMMIKNNKNMNIKRRSSHLKFAINYDNIYCSQKSKNQLFSEKISKTFLKTKTPIFLKKKSSVFYLDKIAYTYKSNSIMNSMAEETEEHFYNYMYEIDDETIDDILRNGNCSSNELIKKLNMNESSSRFELLVFGYIRELEFHLKLQGNEYFMKSNVNENENIHAIYLSFFMELQNILWVIKYFGGYFKFSTADKLWAVMNRRNSMQLYKHLVHISEDGQQLCCDDGYHGTLLIGDYFSPQFNDQIHIYLELIDIQSKHMAIGFVSEHGSCILFYGNGITKMSGDFEFLNRQKLAEFASVRFHTQTTIVIQVDSVLQTAKIYQECSDSNDHYIFDGDNSHKFDKDLYFLLEVNLPERAAIAVYLKDCRQILCIKKQIDANLFE